MADRVSGPETLTGQPFTRSVFADWDDLDAAIDVAAQRAELALVRVEEISPTERLFHLRGVRGEPASLTATRSGPPTAGERSVQIRISAKVGRFGSAERQNRLLDAMERRLRDLQGVDFSPVR